MINDKHQEHELHCCIVCAYCHEGKLLDKLMAKSFKTPSSELTDIAVNHFVIQHTREQVSHNSKPVDAIHHDKHHGAHTSHDCDAQGLPQLHTSAPTWQSKLPCMGFQMLQMQQDWTLGTEMLQQQATSTKECTSAKECTSNWVTAWEVQMPA